MSSLPNILLQKKRHRWPFLLIAVVCIISVLTLAGWATNTMSYKSNWISSLIMYPLSAIYFLLISSAFYLLALPQKKLVIAGYVVIGLVLITIPFKLATAIFQLGSVADILGYEKDTSLIFFTHIPPGISVGFILASLAILFKYIFQNRSKILSQVVAVLLLAWCIAILMLNMFGQQSQPSLIFSMGVTLSSMICFTLLAFAILLFKAGSKLNPLPSRPSPGNILTRILIPASVIITSLIGLIVLSGYHNQRYNAEHGFVYYVLSVVVILVAFYAYNAFLLDKRDVLEEKTEQTLQETEEQMRVIFEAVPEGIILLDEQGKVYSWNSEASVIFGWSAQEVKGRNLVKLLIAVQDQKLCRERGERFLQSESGAVANQSIDVSAMSKDGKLLDISLRMSSLTINNRRFLVWFIHDISIRKSLERQLQSFNVSLEKDVQEKTRELVDIFERVTDGFAALDKDCKFTYVNRRACEMFQTTQSNLLGKCVWDIYPIAVDSATYLAIYEAMRTQKHTQSVDLYAPLGLWQEYNLYPSTNGVSVFVKDITAQKKKEKELLEATALANKLIDSLPGVFYFYDARRKFIKWNKRLEEVTGYSSDEIAVMDPIQLFPQDEREYMAGRIATVFEKGMNNAEADFISKAGKRITYYFKAVLLEYKGEPCLLGSGIDITEKKKSSEKLKQSYDEIKALTEYLNKVREEERMRISHEIHDELGQLLTVLKMDISWINKRIPDSNIPIKNKIDETLEIADQTISTIRRIASELRPALLDNLGLHAAMLWHINEFENRFGILTEAKLPDAELGLSEERVTGMYRILQESLTNVARHSQAEKVVVHMYQEDLKVILTISDNGKGFDTNKHTLKTLGLLGMKERTLGMGGEYSIDSIPGKGTTVKVVVPV